MNSGGEWSDEWQWRIRARFSAESTRIHSVVARLGVEYEALQV
jgi:hypothetical protein